MNKFKIATIHQALAAMTGSTMANHILGIEDVFKAGKKAMKRKDFKTQMQIEDDENMQPIYTHTKFAEELFNRNIGLNISPFFNSQLLGCRMHPFVECYLATMSPLKTIHPNILIDENVVRDCYEKFQKFTQTQAYLATVAAWEAGSSSSQQKIDGMMKTIVKHVNGIEMLELNLSFPLQEVPLALRYSLQDGFIDHDVIDSIVCDIRSAEPNRLLAICSKLEMTIHNQLKLRLIIFLERKCIDDPEGFTDSRFFPWLKFHFEWNSVNTITLEEVPLNGFLMTNKFYKQLPLFKDQIQLLKTYLVGTETLFRVGGIEPTFKILYAKYKS